MASYWVKVDLDLPTVPHPGPQVPHDYFTPVTGLGIPVPNAWGPEVIGPVIRDQPHAAVDLAFPPDGSSRKRHILDFSVAEVRLADGFGPDKLIGQTISWDRTSFTGHRGSAGNNRFDGGGGSDETSGRGGKDRLFGNAGNDALDGDPWADRLAGGVGNDGPLGGAGANTLLGGPGRDVMNGGSGNDHFVFLSPVDSRSGSAHDPIRNFVRGEDRIDLTAIDAIHSNACA